MSEKIYVIGDSHVKVFVENMPEVFTSPFDITDVFVSKSAYAVGINGHNYYLNESIKKIPENSLILLSFGEIDCRHYVPKVARDKGIPIEAAVDEVINRYIPLCVKVLMEKFRVIIMGAYLCPQDRMHHNEVGGDLYQNSYEDIFEAKRIFNEKMKQFCQSSNLLYVPLFETVLENKWHETEPGKIFSDSSHLGVVAVPIVLNTINSFFK